jgi:hypothetical protein
MFDHIIICSTLFGSNYICSKSLKQINNVFLTENKKIIKSLIILNGVIFIGSISIFIYSLHFFALN